MHRAIVVAFQRAFLFEVEGGARILCHAAREREAHARILSVALWSEWLVVRVRKLRNAQRVVQLKGGHAKVFERRDFDRGSRRQLVRLWHQFAVVLEVLYEQTDLLTLEPRPLHSQS